MAKVDKKENTDSTVEKKVEKKVAKGSKKSSYSKKKKIKKNILNGIAYVQSTFNNTIISIADTNGNVISWASAGQKGFKGSRKSTPYAATNCCRLRCFKSIRVWYEDLNCAS